MENNLERFTSVKKVGAKETIDQQLADIEVPIEMAVNGSGSPVNRHGCTSNMLPFPFRCRLDCLQW